MSDKSTKEKPKKIRTVAIITNSDDSKKKTMANDKNKQILVEKKN